MAVVMPIVGLILGIVAATKDEGHPAKRHGWFVILVSVLAFLFWSSVLWSADTTDPLATY